MLLLLALPPAKFHDLWQRTIHDMFTARCLWRLGDFQGLSEPGEDPTTAVQLGGMTRNILQIGMWCPTTRSTVSDAADPKLPM